MDTCTSPCISDPYGKSLVSRRLFQLSPKKESISPALKKRNMMHLVVKAIKSVGLPKKGASLPAIKKWITANSDYSSRSQTLLLKRAILKGIESGTIVRPPHSKDARGITGSFALPSTPKDVKRHPKKKSPENKFTKLSKLSRKVLDVSKEQNKAQDINLNKKTRITFKSSKEHLRIKKRTKRSSVSPEVSKKSKYIVTPHPKLALMKRIINTSSTPEIDKIEIIFTDLDSDKENIEYLEQESELAKKKKVNTIKVKRKKTTEIKEPKRNVSKKFEKK